MHDIPELFLALNKAGYIDDDIRCEDNKDIIKEYNRVINKSTSIFTKAHKIHKILVDRNYIQDEKEETFGFINGFLYGC